MPTLAFMSPSITDINNYRPVSPDLATSGQPNEAQLGVIAAAGYDVIVNLALHDDPRYSLADEPGIVRALGMDYVHIPVKFDAPNEHDLKAFTAALEKHSGRRVWLHCAANIRVTAFLGLHRVLIEKWAVDPAFELMNSVWKPNKVWASFIAERLGEK